MLERERAAGSASSITNSTASPMSLMTRPPCSVIMSAVVASKVSSSSARSASAIWPDSRV